MDQDVCWPSPVEWIAYCFVPEKRCPYMPLKKFYTSVLDELAAKCQRQLYTGVTFNKTPSMCTYLNLDDSNSVATGLNDLRVNCVPPNNKNIFFVLLIYDKIDEKKMLDYAEKIIECSFFAVAAFPLSFLDYVTRCDQNFNKRDENFRTTIDGLLVDVVHLIVKRKRDLKIGADADALRAQSPTSVSEMYSDKDSIKSLDDEIEIMRNDVHIPSVPEPLSIRLASDFRESAVTAPTPSTSILADMIQLPKERPFAESPTTVARQIVKKQQKTFLSSLPHSKPLTSSKKLVPRLTEQCIFAEHQIKPVSRLSHTVSEENLATGHTVPNFEAAPNLVELCSTVTNPGEFSLTMPSLRDTLSRTDVNVRRNRQGLFKPLKLCVGEFYDVIVSHVSGPSEFYVQPFLHGPYLEMISFSMQLFYSLMDENDLQLSFDNVVRCPDYTQIWCAAPYQETDSNGNNRWNYFRARLLKRLSPSIFQILFVDYGDTAEYGLTSLKVLPESFRQVGEVAIKCRLSQPNIPVEALVEKTENSRNCVMRLDDISGDPLVVSLFLTDGKAEENVGETLAKSYQVVANDGSHPQRSNSLTLGLGRGHKRPSP